MVDITRIKVGDVVYLNSGSPELSVTHVCEADDTIEIQWLDKENCMNVATLPAACLSAIKPEFD